MLDLKMLNANLVNFDASFQDNLTDLFQIDTHPIPAPDAGVVFQYADVESPASGMDDAGYEHPIYDRTDVGTWTLNYSVISKEARAYLENLLTGSPTFMFTRPGRIDATIAVTTRCRRAKKRSITWENAALGIWRNYTLVIEEC